MGKVNRFVDYASPMYWAKVLKKGGVPKRKPYNFTVKIADYTIGESEEKNTAKITFGDLAVSGPNTEGVATGIYDASAPMELKIQFDSIYEHNEGTGEYTGYSLSPISRWEIKTKDGKVYGGEIGMGEKAIGDLFTLDKTTPDEGLFYNQFVLKNIYDCVIFDGCTITFTPVFEQIQGTHLVVYSAYDNQTTTPVLENYAPGIKFEGEQEYKKICTTWMIAPTAEEQYTAKTINFDIGSYLKLEPLDEIHGESENDNVQYAIYMPEASNWDFNDIYVTPDLSGKFSVELKIVHGNPKNENENVLEVNKEALKSGEPLYLYINFIQDETKCVTVKAHSNDETKGLVSVTTPVVGETLMSKDITTYVAPNAEVTYKAIPATGTYKFDGWFDNDGIKVTDSNPYTFDVEAAGATTELNAHFSSPGITFTIRKKNYYDASIDVDKWIKNPETGEYNWVRICEGWYDYTNDVEIEEDYKTHYGDKLRIFMTYDNEGFKNPKLYVGNQEIDYTQYSVDGYAFMLDETTADATYGLSLKDGYGAVFAEIYPDEYKWRIQYCGGIYAYIMDKKEAPTKFDAATHPFTGESSKWTRVIDYEYSPGKFCPIPAWKTKAINLVDEATGEKKEYWVGFEWVPEQDIEEPERPYLPPWLSHWKDSVNPQSWGGAYRFVYGSTLSYDKEERYRYVRLSANVVDDGEKAAKLGTFNVVSFAADESGAEVQLNAKAQLVMHDSQTLLSLFEESPRCVFDKTYDNLVRISAVEKTLTYEGENYTFNSGGCSADPDDLVKNYFIDAGGMGTVTFTDAVKTTENPVITLHLCYNKTPTDDDAKEKLADIIKPLEKDYDEVDVAIVDEKKEEVIDDKPVEDYGTDEVDVAEVTEAVAKEEEPKEEPIADELATEPEEEKTEDKVADEVIEEEKTAE